MSVGPYYNLPYGSSGYPPLAYGSAPSYYPPSTSSYYMPDLLNTMPMPGPDYGMGNYVSPVSVNSNVTWYNTAIAPMLQEADAMTKSILGGVPTPTTIPPGYGTPYGQPTAYPPMPPQQLPEVFQDHQGKSSGNSMVGDLVGFAGLGGGIGFCFGGPVGAGIGAAIGAGFGTLKHFFLG